MHEGGKRLFELATAYFHPSLRPYRFISQLSNFPMQEVILYIHLSISTSRGYGDYMLLDDMVFIKVMEWIMESAVAFLFFLLLLLQYEKQLRG